MNSRNEAAPCFGAGQEALSAGEDFSTADILLAVGIWSVILMLSPVIVFYLLMVA